MESLGTSQFKTGLSLLSGLGSIFGILTCYGLDGPGIIPVGGEVFRTCPVWPWGPPSHLYNGYRVFPGGKERPGHDTDTSPHLVSWSWKGRAVPLLPLWAVWPVQSLNACKRVHFTLPFVTAEVSRYLSLHCRASGLTSDDFLWDSWKRCNVCDLAAYCHVLSLQVGVFISLAKPLAGRGTRKLFN
jgi:hypothetical protein